jgi:hypothetical protein
MSKHVETFRSVLLFATVMLLIITLYRRLLFVMGKRKSMTAKADVTARIAVHDSLRLVQIQCERKMQVLVTLCGINQPEGEILFDGLCEIGSTEIPIPETAIHKPYCKVACEKEEFSLYY